MLKRLKAWMKRRVAGAEIDELERLRSQMRREDALRTAGFCAERPVVKLSESQPASRMGRDSLRDLLLMNPAAPDSLAELGCNPPPASIAPGPVPRRRADDVIEDMGLPARARP